MGTVYFLANEDLTFVKIGWTGGPFEKRWDTLQTGSHQALWPVLLVEGDRSLEKQLHLHLRHARRKGEWFETCADPWLKEMVAAGAQYLASNEACPHLELEGE